MKIHEILLVSRIIKLYRLYKHTLELDIFEINYTHNSEELRDIIMSLENPKKNKLRIIRSYFGYFLSSLCGLYLLIAKEKILFKNDIVCFSGTSNQRDIINELNRANFAFDLISLNKFDKQWISIPIVKFISCFFIFKLISHYYKVTGYKKESIKLYWHSYLMSFGLYFYIKLVLQKAKHLPNILINTNDHVMINQTINKAFCTSKIKTIYIQHASVSELRPPLSFSYAFLDGYDSIDKYNNVGYSNTIIFLVGSIKFDNYYTKINTNCEIKSIGICTNTLDSLLLVNDMCLHLKQQFPEIRFTLRPHPGDNRYEKFYEISKKTNIFFSNSRIEKSFSFLENIDLLISGESNIHLEASLLNVVSIYYKPNNYNYNDIYGFSMNNLIRYKADNLLELENNISKILLQKPYVRNNAKYYCSTINTKYDGKTLSLIEELLEAILKNDQIDMQKWKLVKNLKNLTAYELIE